MKKNEGPLTALRRRPITIDQPLLVFWGSKPPEDAIDYSQDEDPPRKKKGSKPEISPIPGWTIIKTYKTESKRGFSLPPKYIAQPFDDSQIEYEIDDEDEEFIDQLKAKKFFTDGGNPFKVSSDLVKVTMDYLEKFAFRQEKQCLSPYKFEGTDHRKKIELLNGCVLPKTVYLKITDYWKRKRVQNRNQPLIESLVEEENRRQALEREATKQRIKKMQTEYDELWALRREFERIRMLLDTIKKREKMKAQITDELVAVMAQKGVPLPVLDSTMLVDQGSIKNSPKRSPLPSSPLKRKINPVEPKLQPPTKIAKTTASSSPVILKKPAVTTPASPSKLKSGTSPIKQRPSPPSQPSPSKKARISQTEIDELNKFNRVLKDSRPSPLSRRRVNSTNK